MIDTFASISATRFDVTHTTVAGDKVSFERGVSGSDLARTLPAMLDYAIAHHLNMIMRPTGPGVSFLQLDDLAADKLPAIAAMFLIIKTSPGNHQAWHAKVDEVFVCQQLAGASSLEQNSREVLLQGGDITVRSATALRRQILLGFKAAGSQDPTAPT